MREYIPPIYLHFIFDILQFEISKDSCSGANKLGVGIFFSFMQVKNMQLELFSLVFVKKRVGARWERFLKKDKRIITQLEHCAN